MTKQQQATTKPIPDLWEIAHLKELDGYTLGGRSARDLILECWHRAHDLQRSRDKLVSALSAALYTIRVLDENYDTHDSYQRGVELLKVV